MIDICFRCGRKTRIYAKGYCSSCYEYVRSSKNPEAKKKALIRNTKWRKAHRDYWKKWQEKNKSKWNKYQRERKRNKGKN